ncbi:MAG: FAD-dependent oxidoreductase [Planctomycetota bacterium]
MAGTRDGVVIGRDVAAAADAAYDLVVVGGGIYGVCATLEAARRGKRVLLLEKRDYGSGTSFHSLRILHGGLRYLQSMDVRRFRDSVGERRWFMANFPELCVPLNCLMPLYNRGLKRPGVFRMALCLNEMMSFDRHRGVPAAARLSRGRVLSASATAAAFERVDPKGLKGAAQWTDGLMRSSERVQIELHRWAAACGAVQLNYVEAAGLTREGDSVAGVEAVDAVTGETVVFKTARVLNCAGGWCRSVAGAMDRDVPRLFPRSLAFNLVLDVPALSDSAVAVAPRGSGDMYFLVPWRGGVHAGTYHLAWEGKDADDRTPPTEAVERFLADLNAAVPGWGVGPADVRYVYAGQLPAVRAGAAAMSHVAPFHDHGGGLFSLAGHKYTTARLEALRALRRMFKGEPFAVRPDTDRPEGSGGGPWDGADGVIGARGWQDRLGRLADEESVVYLDDLVMRRLDGVGSADAVATLRDAAAGVLRAKGYDAERLRETNR